MDMCSTCELPLLMLCHLLTGSATTSQSGQASCRSLAKVDFPTAGRWLHRKSYTYLIVKHDIIVLCTATTSQQGALFSTDQQYEWMNALTNVALDRNPPNSSLSILAGAGRTRRPRTGCWPLGHGPELSVCQDSVWSPLCARRSQTRSQNPCQTCLFS